MCVCVLTGIWNDQYKKIMRWWSSKPQSGISQVLDSAAYCDVIIPHHPCYSSPRRIYHTSSSTHLGFLCIRPIIFAYHMRLFAHLGVSCIYPSIPNYHPVTPPPSGAYCVMISPNRLLLLASCDIPANVS